MKFGQLIVRKIIKIVATRCQTLTLKCIKIDFGWGSAPVPTGGVYSSPQAPSWNKADLLLREGEMYREGKGRTGRRRGGLRGEGEDGGDRTRGEETPVCIFNCSFE